MTKKELLDKIHLLEQANIALKQAMENVRCDIDCFENHNGGTVCLLWAKRDLERGLEVEKQIMNLK